MKIKLIAIYNECPTGFVGMKHAFDCPESCVTCYPRESYFSFMAHDEKAKDLFFSIFNVMFVGINKIKALKMLVDVEIMVKREHSQDLREFLAENCISVRSPSRDDMVAFVIE